MWKIEKFERVDRIKNYRANKISPSLPCSLTSKIENVIKNKITLTIITQLTDNLGVK